ncbi:DUF4185 domain-containing protein [Streptantibioticus cattleyicolor]|uniref:DUF4185 domain-containing protein n=1 Tax=Streptantibioticus cattleyicolor (strain ATCC 35852 / DSM 46488 / JCM 4925 / NBRC 14057 / NRRL 8057) TaxID=1003195 RepID=F8JMC5_STREN|nr:DUF4185 domain-containing protein [Streptantibioticus cattleyicolor]AEW99233.1 hypothetical protein SCATT_p10400 [Streptantibioticus cattleyicolor NRRL 8057 = DSM 46488]CCB71724.1 conserved exported protein of unknown function [Streptantibioticus cattleyicolor NRRL 8057 = DSM 46488]
MSTSSQPERRTTPPEPRTTSRRTALKAGMGLALGTGLLGATPAAARTRAPRAPLYQSGTSLCDQPGDSASQQGLGSGDLGIPYFREHDNSWGYVFGDSWTGIQQTGTYIGSPVMLNQANFDASGATPISFTWAMPTGGHAGQLFDYRHQQDNGYGWEFSRIPNDCIEFGGRTYIQYTSVATWTPPAGYDGSLMSGVAYSDDYGVTWQDYPYHWAGDTKGVNQSLYGMWSFAGIDPDGWLYIFSKRWNGSHVNTADGGAIQLFRIRPDDFRAGNFGAQQNWAYLNGSWQWTTAAPPSVILSGNNIGEFSVKRIGNTYCMSYFDVQDYSICTRTAPRPDAVWSAPTPQIVGNNTWPASHWGKPQVPYLYGGYIHPGSASATSLTLMVSQWNGKQNQPPYWVLQFDGINP